MKNFCNILIAVFMLWLCGCADAEHNHPMLKKAAQSKRMGEYRNAELCYKKYLAKNPDSARIHLELAKLYDEELEDYLLAVYHYKEYLRLTDKKDSSDVRAVNGFIERCEQRYVAKTKNVKKVLMTDEQEIERMAEAYKKRLADEQKAMELEVARLKKEAEEEKQKEAAEAAKLQQTAENNSTDSPVQQKVENIAAPIEKAADKNVADRAEKTVEKSENITADSPVAVQTESARKIEETADKKTEEKVSQPVVQAKTKPVEETQFPPMDNASLNTVKETKDREYKIQKGDTFTHLSRKFYGTTRYYRQLMEYNKIPNPNRLKIGKIIKIPALEKLKGEK